MRPRVIYHLQKGVHKGLELKAREKEGGGCGVKSPSFAVSSVPTVNFMATDHSADPASASLWLVSLTNSPPSRGPRKLLFRSLVQQIHTDARRRRRQRDKGFLSTCFPQQMTADLETICFFVNKRHAEELRRGVVSLCNVNMDS